MAEEKAKPKSNAIGGPSPDREQPVEPYAAGKPAGERQDGAGAGPERGDRHDAAPPGETARQRGQGTPQGQREEPDAGHRGQPAGLTTGAATGSGSGAGGGGTGQIEEPDPDSKGGGGREQGFGDRQGRPDGGADGAKHGGR
jgi:hypothetical protein